jgi:hypothetical protein
MNAPKAPPFIQIAAAASESQDAEGNQSSQDWLYALDSDGRVWVWRESLCLGDVGGWAGPLDGMFVPAPKEPKK